MWIAGMLVATGAVVLTTYDAPIRRALHVDHLARHGQWKAVLTEASRLPAEFRSGVALQLVNRAFYELGRMPYEMFSFTQSPESLLVDMDRKPTVEEEGRFMRQRSQLWFQIGALDLRLGMINEAEHEAHETLASWGEQPSVLRQLAICNTVKRQPEAAKVFLRALSHDLHYGREARDLLRRLEADPELSDDPEIAHLRSIMLEEDERAAFRDIGIRCERLLERNPRNRMAFEYLMAAHLLRKDLDQFTAELHRLDDFDYPNIPRHYEEAILIYEMDPSRRADRAGRAISDETLQRYGDFTRVLAGARRSGLRSEAAERALVDGFGDTYFYYWFFGSPLP
jgi:tetratricopeptide (TPR) repeat protein